MLAKLRLNVATNLELDWLVVGSDDVLDQGLILLVLLYDQPIADFHLFLVRGEGVQRIHSLTDASSPSLLY